MREYGVFLKDWYDFVVPDWTWFDWWRELCCCRGAVDESSKFARSPGHKYYFIDGRILFLDFFSWICNYTNNGLPLCLMTERREWGEERLEIQLKSTGELLKSGEKFWFIRHTTIKRTWAQSIIAPQMHLFSHSDTASSALIGQETFFSKKTRLSLSLLSRYHAKNMVQKPTIRYCAIITHGATALLYALANLSTA